MVIKIDDLRFDAWWTLAREISKGHRPKIEYLCNALRRGENVPAEAQVYIAGLLDGSIEKRGRPRNEGFFPPPARIARAIDLVARIEPLRREFKRKGTCNPAELAFRQVADERGRSNWKSVERSYRAAINLLRAEALVRALHLPNHVRVVIKKSRY